MTYDEMISYLTLLAARAQREIQTLEALEINADDTRRTALALLNAVSALKREQARRVAMTADW